MNHLDYRQPTASALSSRSMSRAWLLSLGLLGVAVVEPAWAVPTESCDLDCPLGTTCEISNICLAIGCPEDNPDCPPSCAINLMCAPAACESDNDCSNWMKCVDLGTDCSEGNPLLVPTANDGSDAPSSAPGVPACEPRVALQCVPRWHLPCTADSDCGEGFRCEESESCSVPPYDPSSSEAQNSDVTCVPSGVFACVVVETACNTEADCPADFSCVDNPNGTCSSGRDGQTYCPPVDPPQVCAPPSVTTSAPGNLATASSGQSSPPAPLADDVGGTEASATGGCALNGATPASPLALLSTLGLGLAFGARRRRQRAR